MAGSTRNPWDENYSTEGDSASGGKPWEQSYQEPEKPKRTWGEAIKDTGAQLAEGVNTTLGAIPSAIAPQSKAAGFFRDNAEHWRDQQSDVLKGRIAETDKRIQEAGKDGVMSQIGTAASEYWNDPAQAARLVATNLPSMAATLGTGAAAGFAAKGVAAARGLDAANKAALAAKYGTTTAAATNAALNAGGARGEAFEDLQKTALAQGMSPEQAEQAGVSGSILPGVVGGVAGAISGKIGLEKALLGQATTGAFMRKAGGAFGAELAGEQIEELAPKVATNYQVGQLDAARGLTDDVGRTMVETAIGSGPGAVVAGGAAGVSGFAQDAPPADAQQPPATPPAPPRPQAGPALALPAPDPGVIAVDGDGTARTPAYQKPSFAGEYADVTDVVPKAFATQPADPVRAAVESAANAGGALSGAALVGIDTGASQQMADAVQAQSQADVSDEAAKGSKNAAQEQPVPFQPAVDGAESVGSGALSPEERSGLATTIAGRELAGQPLSPEMAGLQAQLTQVQQRAAENGSWNVPLMAQRKRLEDAIAKLKPMELPAERQAEAANAQAAKAPAPAAAPAPGPTGAAAVEAAGVAPQASIQAITAKQIPDMTDGELQAAIAHYGPAHKRTAKLQKEVQRRAATVSTTTEGSTNATQTAQAQQTSAQPAQAGPAQPAQGLTDAAPAANPGAQGTAASGAQAQTQGAAWDGLDPQQRTAVLSKAGWITNKGGLNVIGKRLLNTSWEQITGGTREIIARNIENEQGVAATAGVQEPPSRTPEATALRLGRDSTPLSEGGKPFKTRKAAGDAKKQQPMMRVVTVPGGFALAEKTPAQLAAEAKAARRLAQPRTGTAGAPLAAHEFIAAEGGLSSVAAADLGVDGNPRIGNRTLFAGRGRGMSMERAAEKLIAEGYLGEGATLNDAYDLIKLSLSRPQYNADGIERIAEAENGAQYEDYLAAQEDALDEGDPWAGTPAEALDDFSDDMLEASGYDAATDVIKTEVRALLEMTKALGIDTDSITEEVHEQTRNATDREYYETAKSALEAAIARSRGDSGALAGGQGQRAGAAEGVQELDQPEALELASQTQAEAAAQKEAEDQAAKADAARQRAADAQAAKDEDRKRIAQASVRAADSFELGQDPLDSLTGQGSMFDDAPAQQTTTQAAADDDGRERFTLSIEMFGDVPYIASKPVDAGSGEVVSSRVITTKTKLTAANAQALGLPKDKGTVYAWRVSVIRRANGETHSVIEAMATDNGRSPDGEVLAHFKEVENPEAMERIAPAIANAALADWRAAQQQQAPTATETVAPPITRADVTAAQQQATTLIAERIDAMTAGEVNTIARRFLPTMGVKPTVSKERNKVAVTDFTKVNPMAAADEFGVTLSADVRRALDAEMQGKVADAGQDDGVNPRVPRENRAQARPTDQGEQKEPWQMTAMEFGQQERGNPHWNQSYAGKDDGAYLADVQATHARLVQEAVDAGLVDATERPAATKQEADEQQARADNRKKVKQGTAEASPVTDFGEKLEGARKDMPPSLREDVSDEQIANLPLSKVWPSDAHESIEDDVAAALTFAARQEIPSKPRVPSRVRAWVEKVKMFREVARDLSGRSLEGMERHISMSDKFKSLAPFFAKVRLLSQLPRDTWSRVERVEEYPNAIRYEKDGSKTAVALSFVTIDGKSHRFEGVGKIGPDEVQKVKEMLGTAAPKKSGLTPADFEVRGTAKTGYKINRKGDSEYRSLKIFTGEDAAKKALAWRDEHTAELEAAWEAVKARDNVSKAEVRRDENRERTGENRRNGRDVTAQMFTDAFGFRGAQFGNWVGQGADAKSRQGMLNDAYDALLDLSDILGIPSRAISLNGTLGLSFGARGSGKAAAHFEPSNLVINLTKTRGAGSLAHEWFHALDNYFSRMRGGEVAFTGDNNAYRQNNFVTYKPEAAWGKAPITPYTNFMRGGQLRERLQRLPGFTYDANKTLAENAKAAGFERDPNHKDGVRPQVEKAFADLVQALNESPMAERASALDKAADGYWGRIIERGARSFENYVISKMAQRGWSNDFLANIRSFDEWMAMGKNAERYPYLKPEEDAPVVEAFDKLFQTAETKEDDTGNVVMFSRSGAQSANANDQTSRSWYDRFVSLLPDAYRNDPHRREPLPAEDWNVQRAAEVHRKVEAINQQLRGENDRKGYGPISIDGLGNLQVSALQVSRDDLNGPIKALANELGAGIAVTKVRAADIQALQRKGFVAEISLAPVADRIMGREFVTPANAYATDAGAQGTIMTYKPRGFPAVLFARDTAIPPADSNARNVATQMLVDGLKAKWTRAPEIIVARNMQDAQIPQEVRDYDALLKSQGATGEPRGFIYKGKVYLLSDQLKGPQQIAEVLFHEVLGHYGLRGVFGDSLNSILQQMGTMRRRDVVAKAREYGLFNKDALGGLDKSAASDSQIWAAMSAKDRLSAAEEVLAEMAQTQPNIGFVQRAIAAIRNWLRANVPGFERMRLTDADIVQAYILPARGYVTRSNETAQQAIDRAMTAFSRDTNGHMPENQAPGPQGDAQQGANKGNAVTNKNAPSSGTSDAFAGRPNNGMQERAVRAVTGSPELAQFSKAGSDGHLSTLRTVDVFGNGNMVEYYDDAKGLMYSVQKYPRGERWTAWDVLPAEEGGNQVIGEFDHHKSFADAVQSIRGARISASAKARLAKYSAIPNTWDGDAKKLAKALIDAGVSIDRFSTSTQSRSKYIYLDDGRKVRLADHELPGAYDAPDYDFRYGGDIQRLVEQIKFDQSTSVSDDVSFSRTAGDQTQTENFRRWFAGSKAVDAEGKPLRVFHGTRGDTDFSIFKGSKFYFSPDPEYAGGYADGAMIPGFPAENSRVMPVYLSAQNPLDLRELGERQVDRADLIKRLERAGVSPDGIASIKRHTDDFPMPVWTWMHENSVRLAIQEAGFDAVFQRESNGVLAGDAFIVFRPEQVKSAIGNRGTFDPTNPDIRFSRATEAAKAAGDAIKSVTVTNIKKKAGFKLTDYLGIGLQALGRRQIVDLYGDMLPLAEYNRLVTQMEADKNEGGAEADQLVTRWAKLPDEAKLADLMHDATLAQIDPAKPYVDGDDKARYMTLQGRFKALSAEAKQVYTDTRDSYQAHHAKVRSAIKERIERSELKGPRKAELLKQMDDEFFAAVKGVYFPLARFGQYAVTVKGADGKVESVSRAETKAEAEALRNSLLSAFPRDKGFTVGRVMLSKDFIANRDAVGRGFMTELYQVLDKQDMDAAQRAELEDTLGQLYLSSLPDLSWAKHGIHRKGTPGFSQDARRAYAQNMFHGSRYLAKLRYSDLMQDELTAMQKHVDDRREVEDFDQNKAQRVVDEMNKRHESLMNPKSSPLSTALTSFGFIFHLGLSPASALVNLSQTALVAYPIMGAKWGFNKASAALLKASADAAKGKNDITGSLNADERAAYDEAVRAGTIDVTMAHDLAGIAQGEDAGVMWKMRPVMRWASFLFHHAERFNRQVTFVASYRLARDTGISHKAAFEQATKATYDGHFDYGAANRPRVMQGNAAKVLLLFKQYGQNMVYTLSRNAYQSIKGTAAEKAEARKALAGLLTSHAMAAGVLGLPMVSTLLAAASMIGGDDDEPWDAKVALQNMLADTFGQKPAEVLAHGLSRLTPWDISGRVGLDRLIFPDVQEGLEGQRLAESAMVAALGPVAGIGVNVLKGAQHMSEGRYAMGLEAMLPSALRGPVKALRYAEEGVQDKSGISILDEVSPAAVAGQALGFSPSAARNAQEGKSAVMAHDRALGERRQELLTKAARAAMAKDAEALAEARKEIAGFNEKNPGRRITPLNITQSVRNRQKRIDQSQDGVYLPKNRRDAMEAGRFALGD